MARKRDNTGLVLLTLGTIFALGSSSASAAPSGGYTVWTGELPDPNANDDNGGGGTWTPVEGPSDVLDVLTKPTPTIGHLYQVKQGDSPGAVIQELLGVQPGHPRVAPYFRRLILSRWNWMLYATEGKANTYWSALYDGVWGQLGAAFLPMNERVDLAVAAGRLPQRAVGWTRNPNSGLPVPKSTATPVLGPKTWGRIFFPPENPPVGFDSPQANPASLFAALGQPITALEP